MLEGKCCGASAADLSYSPLKSFREECEAMEKGTSTFQTVQPVFDGFFVYYQQPVGINRLRYEDVTRVLNCRSSSGDDKE